MIDTILQTLLKCWLYDVAVFSSPWLYIPFLIPAVCYLTFFCVKWMVLTLPVWLPIRLALDGIQGRKRRT